MPVRIRAPSPSPLSLGLYLYLRFVQDDPIQSSVEVGPGRVREAMSGWLSRYEGQALSLVDAVSFEAMRTEKVTTAFAFHHHFEVAGFELLC